MPTRVLLTAFGPFAGFSRNPSELVLRQVLDVLSRDTSIVIDSDVLEVSYQAVDTLVDTLRGRYDLALHMGVASGAPKLRLELLARNAAAGTDVRSVNRDAVIRRGTPDLPTQFPLGLLHAFSSRHADAVVVSDDAGAYLCNYLYFRSSERLRDATPALFVHVADFHNVSEAAGAGEQAALVVELIRSFAEECRSGNAPIG